jgi:hypothetical protein
VTGTILHYGVVIKHWNIFTLSPAVTYLPMKPPVVQTRMTVNSELGRMRKEAVEEFSRYWPRGTEVNHEKSQSKQSGPRFELRTSGTEVGSVASRHLHCALLD